MKTASARRFRRLPIRLLLQADDGRLVEVNESWWHQSGYAKGADRTDPATWTTKRSARRICSKPLSGAI